MKELGPFTQNILPIENKQRDKGCVLTMEIKLFAEILKYPYVIIYDKANGNKLHKTNCSYVTKENYDLKVILNQEKNGYYHPLVSLDNINDTTVKACKVCKPI